MAETSPCQKHSLKCARRCTQSMAVRCWKPTRHKRCNKKWARLGSAPASSHHHPSRWPRPHSARPARVFAFQVLSTGSKHVTGAQGELGLQQALSSPSHLISAAFCTGLSHLDIVVAPCSHSHCPKSIGKMILL